MTVNIHVGQYNPDEYERLYPGEMAECPDDAGSGCVDCPNADHDVCDEEYTVDPRAPWRSIPNRDAFQWIGLVVGEMPDGWPNVSMTIDEFMDKIKATNKFHDELWDDRRKWWNYWSAKAKELYGENARVWIH